MLEQKKTLLSKHDHQRTDSHVYFEYLVSEADDRDAYKVGYYLPVPDWMCMGSPDEITVTVVPGNNNISEGMKDEGRWDTEHDKSVEWDIDRNMSVSDAAVFNRGMAHARRLLGELEEELNEETDAGA